MQGLLSVLGRAGDSSSKAPRTGDNNSIEEGLGDEPGQQGFESAATDCFQALQTGDEGQFKEALQAAIEMAR